MEIRPCSITMADYHHTAGSEKNAEEIRREHMGPPNYWGDIGYNLVVLPSGGIEWGRDIKYSGAHDPGPAPDGSGYTMNQRAFAIVCIGNFEEQEMSEAQYQGLLKGALWAHDKFKLSFGDHHRHRDQYATKCPGGKFPWERLMVDLKKETERDEEKVLLENVVVYYTAKDQSFADLYADEFKCLMTCRNGAATTLPEAMAARRLFNIGGPKLGHPNEIYLSGEKAKHTAKNAADWLVANTI